MTVERIDPLAATKNKAVAETATEETAFAGSEKEEAFGYQTVMVGQAKGVKFKALADFDARMVIPLSAK